MRLQYAAALMAAVASAAPMSTAKSAKSQDQSPPQAYTGPIAPSAREPPPLWDPLIARPPPLFEAPAEDIPELPASLLAVPKALVQDVRPERLSVYTGSVQQPIDNIYAPSKDDPDAMFAGLGSLRPASRTVLATATSFLRSWAWWISVVVIACILVYIAEKMLIGAVIGAKRARSVSRVARSRAASLVAVTQSRAASLVRGSTGRGRSGTATMNLWQEKMKLERSRSPPLRPRCASDASV